MGTDQLGRDVLSRILTGGKISPFLGLSSGNLLGDLWCWAGLIAGYFGGLIDRVLTSILGLFWAVPGVLFVVIIALVVGSAKVGIVAGIAFVMWVEMTQIVKTRVKVIRKKEYVQASRMIGLSHFQLINKHILQNVIAPVFVLSASAFADALMLEAGLSFFG